MTSRDLHHLISKGYISVKEFDLVLRIPSLVFARLKHINLKILAGCGGTYLKSQERQADFCMFEANLFYVTSSRSARVTH